MIEERIIFKYFSSSSVSVLLRLFCLSIFVRDLSVVFVRVLSVLRPCFVRPSSAFCPSFVRVCPSPSFCSVIFVRDLSVV
uniref:Candidate secreted effector n=1 Tax=Meloidogyne incognita TaxID=6306 RepID=A0A914MEK9_MELIC